MIIFRLCYSPPMTGLQYNEMLIQFRIQTCCKTEWCALWPVVSFSAFSHYFFPSYDMSVLGPTQPPVHWLPMGGGLSPGITRGRGVTLTTHHHLALRSSPPLRLTRCVVGQLYFLPTICTFVSFKFSIHYLI
jgi:hypothetical protein